MIVVENIKAKRMLEGFTEEFTQLLKKYDFEFNNTSKMLSEIRKNKTFQLKEKYDEFNLATTNVRELQIDAYRDSIESIEERCRTYFSGKTIEDRIAQIVNSRHLRNYKTIENVEEIRKLTGKNANNPNRLHLQSYAGFLKFHLYDKYSIRSLVSDLRELFSYLDRSIYKQKEVDFKRIENYEPCDVSDNLTLVLYKNHNVKISYVKKPKPAKKNVLREVYEIFKRFNASDYFKYL